jgi:hypothetical protein
MRVSIFKIFAIILAQRRQVWPAALFSEDQYLNLVALWPFLEFRPYLPMFGVAKLVANEKTMMAIANPQVNRSSKSPVFLTPIMLLAPDPPNWLDSPPPFEF